MSKKMIFCDFDGTITLNDNIIALMKQFAPPEWEAIKDAVLEQRISIQEGVSQMFALITSSKRAELTDYLVTQAELRPGFLEFVQFAKEHDYELKVLSGGIGFFVYPLLEGIIPREDIYCNEADFSQETINILWPYSCDEQCQNGCGCCKTSLIRKLAPSDAYKIVIGDSVTDLEQAKLADYVFACDYLLEKCEQLSIRHESFETFYDVMNGLREIEVRV
ncbi:2-hydroxy-3-keto-5-methylthiopentenyl-1-phosphate phosphatase [Bacillus solimangrovi]|uniref:2-hydroxy-3-keto-5-methylthiopentenyl-1-phosphate phosphatase n=1 Tax=Bacillus solimangrovi TaxID=1305675 RepID=A0A1E5LE67_9BACI|nr:2-hydroxy-3-keto-5-methylthiopentenyl-1-phosphate phosphatase [Bacillus solimangrovi]OEH92378.1 2-hydroxy-3-keto-5-methylthiopentenyl-1-phosphate phosphatase [Bacillus solimangrovi]